jgi:hypothetical protein
MSADTVYALFLLVKTTEAGEPEPVTVKVDAESSNVTASPAENTDGATPFNQFAVTVSQIVDAEGPFHVNVLGAPATVSCKPVVLLTRVRVALPIIMVVIPFVNVNVLAVDAPKVIRL